MNNERYNQIIDEAYENYKHYFENKYGNYITGKITKEDGDYLIVNKHPLPQETILSIIYSKEEFINKCKTDSEFSKKWGLMIKETYKLVPNKHYTDDSTGLIRTFPVREYKLIVVYKDEIIEVYE